MKDKKMIVLEGISGAGKSTNIKMSKLMENGVRIDIWTHLMRECIMKLCTPI